MSWTSSFYFYQRFDEAASVFYEGVKLDPENKELVEAFRYNIIEIDDSFVILYEFRLKDKNGACFLFGTK